MSDVSASPACVPISASRVAARCAAASRKSVVGDAVVLVDRVHAHGVDGPFAIRAARRRFDRSFW